MPLRLFVALPLPTTVQELLSGWIEKKSPSWSFHKWVHPQDLHITVHFLGSCTLSQTEQIKRALNQVVKGETPFTLTLDQWGTFGLPEQPRILWMGVKGDLDQLQLLQQKVTASLATLGFLAEDRPYRPHITLARKYQGQSFRNSQTSLPWKVSEASISWQVDHSVLFNSQIGRVPMYEPVHSFHFYAD